MKLTQTQFLKGVEDHQMVVLRDDGVNRHIRFKAPGTMMKHFDLITWPGYLCYTGDMGSFLFRRTNDMFAFFRTDRSDFNFNRDGGLSINPGYWSEKLEAVEARSGYEEFDEDEFKRVISEYRIGWIRRESLSKSDRRELWDSVNDVLEMAEEGESRAKHAAYDFSFKADGKTFQFDDFFEHRLTKYTHRFMWCCYALAWGVAHYDNVAALNEVAV